MPEQNTNVEVRFLPLEKVELREAEGDGSPKIAGYAAVFDSLSEDMGGFREIVRAGAFSRTLEENTDVRSFWNHDPNRIIGRTKSGTLTVEQDEVGLRFEVKPPTGPTGQDVVEAVRRGDVDAMSFGFVAKQDKVTKREDGTILRELLDLDLFEVSPVTFPAYPSTSAEIRSAVQELQNAEDEDEAVEETDDSWTQDLRRRRLEIEEKELA